MNPDQDLACCPVCRNVYTLIDMAEKARARGYQYPDRPDRFAIECATCKMIERFSDSDLYFRVVAAIQREMGGDKPAG
ncbi:MAG: hypothetical protein C0467_04055 [Planctomycetaceae bacterium]|nr:hypothetical protein [Planctomycetaceae bacterium]